MELNRRTLSHQTTIGTYTIVRLPGVTRDAFLDTLRDEVLGQVFLPPLNRATNLVGQDLYMKDDEDGVDMCLWAISFNGVHSRDLVRDSCEAMYESIREQLETVGTRVSFQIATLEAGWDADL